MLVYRNLLFRSPAVRAPRPAQKKNRGDRFKLMQALRRAGLVELKAHCPDAAASRHRQPHLDTEVNRFGRQNPTSPEGIESNFFEICASAERTENLRGTLNAHSRRFPPKDMTPNPITEMTIACNGG